MFGALVTRPASAQARRLLADAVAAKGSAWRNAADSIRSGGYANAWIDAALVAIDAALKEGPDDGE